MKKELSLSINKRTDTLTEQTETKPQEKLQVKLNRAIGHFFI